VGGRGGGGGAGGGGCGETGSVQRTDSGNTLPSHNQDIMSDVQFPSVKQYKSKIKKRDCQTR